MTASYTVGTVSVTAGSDIVTGSGTAWLSSNIAPGFLDTDNASGNPVPVLEVLTDTRLRLVKPWRGATGSGLAYWLSYDTRDGQQTVNNAQRLAEYIALLRSSFFTAFAALTPTADTFPYFGAGAAAALATVTSAGRALLAASGAQDTFPYFSALNTLSSTALTAFGRSILGAANSGQFWNVVGELPSAQLPPRLAATGPLVTDLNAVMDSGFYRFSSATNAPFAGAGTLIHASFSGTANFQIASRLSGTIWETYFRSMAGGTWSAWERSVGQRGILGSVSQAAGLPTGAIIERGSNSNGEYVRFADGTQICTYNAVFTITTTALGGIFRDTTSVGSWTFPIAFASAPSGSINAASTNQWANSSGINLTQFTGVTVFSGTAISGGSTRISFVAVGRWY